MLYLYLKLIHIISATLIFGTGLGSAYYFYQAQHSNNLQTMFNVARYVVFADWVFTTPAVILQPISGVWMMYLAGYSFTTTWVWLTLLLYVLIGCCWIPVLYLQIKMQQLLHQALLQHESLPLRYQFYYRCWYWLGWPAFSGVIIIFGLMVLKPA